MNRNNNNKLGKPGRKASKKPEQEWNGRILGEGVTVDNSLWGINSNDLIIGSSGAGKTRGYVVPNLFYGKESKIVADTKCNQYKKYAPFLEKMGYRVELVDFVKPERSTIGYNPLRFIRKDGKAFVDDVKKVAEALCPNELDSKELFWSQQGQMYLEFAISYVLEENSVEHQNLPAVEKIAALIGTETLGDKVSDLANRNPGSRVPVIYNKIIQQQTAEKMQASILGFVNIALNQVCDGEISHLYHMGSDVDFRGLGREKTIIFINVSDTDRTREALINIFYSQAFQELVSSADENENSMLEVPVRVILDDFAANVIIPDFDKLISTIRSRQISVSIILQSIMQLNSMYGEARAMTIIDNCDTQVFLGGQNLETAKYFGVKMDKLPKTLLALPAKKECVFIRGQDPRIVNKYDLSVHERELLGQNGAECDEV